MAARDRLADEAQRLGRLAITDALMTLELSGGRVLRLGEPLTGDYPPPLRELTLPDLRALLQPLDKEPTPVADWSDLSARMGYIAALFRAHHTDATLFDAPFRDEEG